VPKSLRWAGFVALAVSAIMVVSSARAQRTASPLVLPDSAVEGSANLKIGTAFGKPKGAGPFPALVLLQTCSGATADMRDWGQRAIEHGYVALVVDSMGPRGVTGKNCNLPAGVRARDADQARAHLAKFDFVDRSRIGLLGFSAGAGATLLSAGVAVRQFIPDLQPWAAAVAFYPGCTTTLVPTTLTGPLLILLGTSDSQSRPAECVPKFEALKAAGADISWHIYQGASHCFDCRSESGKEAIDTFHNQPMTFIYNAKATADAEQRTFEFFASRLKVGG